MTLAQVNLFILAILGHFAGDYLFQNDWMAVNKSSWQKAPKWWKSFLTPNSIKGHVACTTHVVLYTLTICLMTGELHWLVALVIGLPHWLIDRFSLAARFMKWKNSGRYPFDALKDNEIHPSPRQIWQVSFIAPVYIFNDNTIHWLCLWLTVRYLM